MWKKNKLVTVKQPYYIAETTMPGKNGFDLNGASQSFNVLSAYLFGKNTTKESMEMTTPVFTRRTQSEGEKMEMTTPVITKRLEDDNKWQMSFVMPSKYGSSLPLPKDPSVAIKEVPSKIVSVAAFSGSPPNYCMITAFAYTRPYNKDGSSGNYHRYYVFPFCTKMCFPSIYIEVSV